MKIKLDKNHYLNSDAYNYWITVVVQNKNKDGEYERVVSGYHQNPLRVIETYVERKVASSEATKLSELFKEVEALKKQIKGWKSKVEKGE